jgi:hypothetical protein
MSDDLMWRFLKRMREITEEDFSPRHTDNSDEVSDKELQASDKLHCTSAKMETKKPVYTMKWTLHGLVIKVVLFLYA